MSAQDLLNAMEGVLVERRAPSFSRMADAIRSGDDEAGQREFNRLVFAAIKREREMTPPSQRCVMKCLDFRGSR